MFMILAGGQVSGARHRRQRPARGRPQSTRGTSGRSRFLPTWERGSVGNSRRVAGELRSCGNPFRQPFRRFGGHLSRVWQVQRFAWNLYGPLPGFRVRWDGLPVFRRWFPCGRRFRDQLRYQFGRNPINRRLLAGFSHAFYFKNRHLSAMNFFKNSQHGGGWQAGSDQRAARFSVRSTGTIFDD